MTIVRMKFGLLQFETSRMGVSSQPWVEVSPFGLASPSAPFLSWCVFENCYVNIFIWKSLLIP